MRTGYHDTRHSSALAAAILAAALLAGCTAPRQAATPAPAEAATAAPATATSAPSATPAPTQAAASPTPAPSATPAEVPTVVPTRVVGAELPGALVVIDGRQQLARIDPDGTVAELTSEPGNILEFDVSPADGALVYLLYQGDGRYTLIQTDAQGRGRAELASGVLRLPMFDPRGERIVFAVDVDGAKAGDSELGPGVWSIPSGGGAPEQLLANIPPDPPSGEDVIPGLRYAPAAWSPDGTQLLIYTAPNFGPDLPAGDIGILGLGLVERSGGEVRSLVPPGGNPLMCISPVWSEDSAAVYCPAPYFLGEENPALFRIDLESDAVVRLIPRDAGDGRAAAVHGLRAGADGVTALVTYSKDDQADGAAIERYTDDPASRSVLATLDRDFEPGGSVLWAADGSGAVLSLAGNQPALLWQPFGGPARVLIEGLSGRARWAGGTP
jgi:hypothetical protein